MRNIFEVKAKRHYSTVVYAEKFAMTLFIYEQLLLANNYQYLLTFLLKCSSFLCKIRVLLIIPVSAWWNALLISWLKYPQAQVVKPSVSAMGQGQACWAGVSLAPSQEGIPQYSAGSLRTSCNKIPRCDSLVTKKTASLLVSSNIGIGRRRQKLRFYWPAYLTSYNISDL